MLEDEELLDPLPKQIEESPLNKDFNLKNVENYEIQIDSLRLQEISKNPNIAEVESKRAIHEQG